MPIPNKLRHKLVRLLAGLVRDKKVAITYAEHAELDTAVIEFDDMALVNWDRIVDHADDNNKLCGLLEVMLETFNNNDALTAIYKEVKEGFDNRVEIIAKSISLGQCALFLGPELLQIIEQEKVTPFREMFSRSLADELEKEGVYYERHQADDLGYIAQRYEEMPTFVNGETADKAKKAFTNARKNAAVDLSVYEQLAGFSFPIIINTNPDTILEELYTKKNTVPLPKGDYYDMSNDGSATGSFTPGTPVIYNIFGSFQNPFTIVFTDSDKVKFAKNVVRNDPPIPPLIKKMLENKYYVFLGFNFGEWHLKFLIDCLGLSKKEDRSFVLAARLEEAGDADNEYFEREYKFYFINKDMKNFIRQVTEAYTRINTP